jgi:hypothetical protein
MFTTLDTQRQTEIPQEQIACTNPNQGEVHNEYGGDYISCALNVSKKPEG